MPNLYEPEFREQEGLHRARLAQAAGARQLGMTLYDLAPGERMVYHYHLGREELLIVVSGSLSLRTAEGWQELPQGDVVAFPRGETGAHGFENRGDGPVRVLVVSEQTWPNVTVYPDTDEVGVFDAALPEQRRFGALFRVGDAVSGDGGGRAAGDQREPA